MNITQHPEDLFAMRLLLLLSRSFKTAFPPLVLLMHRNFKRACPPLVFYEYVLLYCSSGFRETVLLLICMTFGDPVFLTSSLPNSSWSNGHLVFKYFVHIQDVIRLRALSARQIQLYQR